MRSRRGQLLGCATVTLRCLSHSTPLKNRLLVEKVEASDALQNCRFGPNQRASV